jgi:hypothetical protein
MPSTLPLANVDAYPLRSKRHEQFLKQAVITFEAFFSYKKPEKKASQSDCTLSFLRF